MRPQKHNNNNSDNPLTSCHTDGGKTFLTYFLGQAFFANLSLIKQAGRPEVKLSFFFQSVQVLKFSQFSWATIPSLVQWSLTTEAADFLVQCLELCSSYLQVIILHHACWLMLTQSAFCIQLYSGQLRVICIHILEVQGHTMPGLLNIFMRYSRITWDFRLRNYYQLVTN